MIKEANAKFEDGSSHLKTTCREVSVNRTFLTIGIVALLAMISPNIRAQTVISAPQTGSSFGYPWGVTNTATYGDTVTVPTNGDTELNSFTFYLGPQDSGSGAINYEAYVYGWNSGTDMATGSALYSSGPQSYTAGAGFSPVTFHPSIDLTAGGSYVLFFSTSGLQGGQPISTIEWATSNTVITGVTGVYLNNGNDPSLWTTAGWATGYGGTAGPGEFATSIDFGSPVVTPELSSLLLYGTGLLALLAKVARSKRYATSSSQAT
jgi:hypothetical protein